MQDDPSDVEVHYKSMSKVYANSFCTILATGALDGTEGCFMPRSKVKVRPCIISPAFPPEIDKTSPIPTSTLSARKSTQAKDPLTDSVTRIRDVSKRGKEKYRCRFTVLPTFREWTHSMTGPLLKRGWTLHERELSVRVVHFTADRVAWECR